ncbi:UvrD-helicase domain-containing protein, partial [Candidatus Roizmanbacteria bacterium]|nr:UvrD-helicase domain-containing protein [Candidatus Roizmanbacteria bacterium]
MNSDIFKNLNKQQQEAVQCVEGPSIIIAGAGSGKTRVLVSKVLHLIQNCHIDPYSIIMITFTNKAANEMKERIKRPVGYVGTFHSFCARVLRKNGSAIGLENS